MLTFFRCTVVILEYVIALLLRLAVCINSIGFVWLLLLYLLFVIFVLRGKLEFIQFEIEIGSLVVNVSASAVFGYLLLNESIFFALPFEFILSCVWPGICRVAHSFLSESDLCVWSGILLCAHFFFKYFDFLGSFGLQLVLSSFVLNAL